MPRKACIHIIDDDKAVLNSTSVLLRIMGYDVAAWQSGEHFLTDAQSGHDDCVLLDLRMPEMDGLDVLGQMAERGIATPVIMLTGHGDRTVAEQARALGAFDVIEKPFNARLLEDVIAKALALARRAN